jgi:excisionase family DNA binding protein
MSGTEKELAVGISEAARRLGISSRTLATLVAQEELPSCKIGRRRLIPVAALKAFVNREYPTPKPKGGRNGNKERN